MAELNETVFRVLEAASQQRGSGFSDDLREALNQLAALENVSEARLAVASRLPAIDSATGAGAIAVWLGAGVESGASPEPTTVPILQAMVRWCHALELPEGTEDEAVEEEPPSLDAEILEGLEMLGRAAVAHLSVHEQVDQFSQNEDLHAALERAEPYSIGAMWVAALFQQVSGELIVIHAERRTGYRIRYDNLANCFHLFTLLQGCLAGKMPGAERPDPQVLAIASGESQGQAYDRAWWHYGIGPHPQPELQASVFGEMSPAAIPEVDGQQVLLLWSPILQSRTWDSGFFGPILHARMPNVRIVDELSREEIERWCERLKLPEATMTSWWKFW
ncbi:MAG: hypothetical protein KDA80_02685 [Planctomycetaceae bacterium]|nr:hypothetical protein [Planctomycetaceae bacterium]